MLLSFESALIMALKKKLFKNPVYLSNVRLLFNIILFLIINLLFLISIIIFLISIGHLLYQIKFMIFSFLFKTKLLIIEKYIFY